MQVRGSAAALVLTLSLLASGCASQHSCPGVSLGSGVHVDVCIDNQCVAAVATAASSPYDLFGYIGLPAGKATVRVKLTASDGRLLDQTATSDVTLAKPFGSGCGGREEIDLNVTKAGTLVVGKPGKLP